MGRSSKRPLEEAEKVFEPIPPPEPPTETSNDDNDKDNNTTTPISLPSKQTQPQSQVLFSSKSNDLDDEEDEVGLTSSSASASKTTGFIGDDNYYSDGSDDDEGVEILLQESTAGVMNKKAVAQTYANRQWVRGEGGDEQLQVNEKSKEELNAFLAKRDMEEIAAQEEAAAAALLDPKTALELSIKREREKLEIAKSRARQTESEENAGRDPCLFSRRTAFDIQMDSIEERPWIKGFMHDYFNYDMSDDEWSEYAAQQLEVRQELTDAMRQKRKPDPAIVPVERRAPVVADASKVAANPLNLRKKDANGNDLPVTGPFLMLKELDEAGEEKKDDEGEDSMSGVGIIGAYGVILPGSKLEMMLEAQIRLSRPQPRPVMQPGMQQQQMPFQQQQHQQHQQQQQMQQQQMQQQSPMQRQQLQQQQQHNFQQQQQKPQGFQQNQQQQQNNQQQQQQQQHNNNNNSMQQQNRPQQQQNRPQQQQMQPNMHMQQQQQQQQNLMQQRGNQGQAFARGINPTMNNSNNGNRPMQQMQQNQNYNQQQQQQQPQQNLQQNQFQQQQQQQHQRQQQQQPPPPPGGTNVNGVRGSMVPQGGRGMQGQGGRGMAQQVLGRGRGQGRGYMN